MSKNITIVSINFYPEDSSTGLYTTQMAEFLRDIGYEVSVVTGFPYYPQWKIWGDYKYKPKYYEETYKGIKIYRYKQFTPKNPNFINRSRHILSFISGSLKNLKKIKNPNLIIAIVPFTFNIWLAYKLQRKKKARLWVHIQDFEFDAAFESGVIKSNFIKNIVGKFLYKIETNLLGKADVVSTISYSMLDKAKRKVKTELFYFPNWIDEDFIDPEKTKIHPYLNSSKFKILYSGNIGAKQDWEFFLEVLERFKNNNELEFIIVGNGAKKEWLTNKIENMGNVKYYAPVPYNELPDLLCSTDLHILFQRSEVVDTVMPSKLLGMMASGKPSLITGNLSSEVAKIIKLSKGGAFFQSSNDGINKVVDFIILMMNNKELAEDYGRSAREYIIEHFSKRKILNMFVDKINKTLER